MPITLDKTKPQKANLERLYDGSRTVGKFRREKHFSKQISIVDPSTGAQTVVARFYEGPTVTYACVWVHGGTSHGHGGGSAGGYGYHKESAALETAIANAGMSLENPIGGRGESAMEEALLAIAQAATRKRKFFVVRAHA